MMKVTPDDPRLSAYLLGELSDEDARVIEHAAASDPVIQMSLRELKKMTGFMEATFADRSVQELLPTQREAIRKEGRPLESEEQVLTLPPTRRSPKPWLSGIGAAAAIVLAALLISRADLGGRSSRIGDAEWISDEIALLPMPGPTSTGGTTGVGGTSQSVVEQLGYLETQPSDFLDGIDKINENGSLPAASSLPASGELMKFSEAPVSRLPVVVGTSSYHWVNGWIREKQQLPPRNAVRIEELINSATLPSSVQLDGLRVGIDSMTTPWNANSALIGIQLHAGNRSVEGLELRYYSKGRHRVLATLSGRDDFELPRTLPAERQTCLLIEVQLSEDTLGELEIRQDGEIHRESVKRPTGRPSTQMKHAAALAGFGIWLRNEGVDELQFGKLLDSLASDQDPVRADVRRMMAEALELRTANR